MKKPKLCCLISPNWVCSICGFQTCTECWSKEYADVCLHTVNTHLGKNFCDKCVPLDADYSMKVDPAYTPKYTNVSHWAYGAPLISDVVNIQQVQHYPSALPTDTN